MLASSDPEASTRQQENQTNFAGVAMTSKIRQFTTLKPEEMGEAAFDGALDVGSVFVPGMGEVKVVCCVRGSECVIRFN